MPRPHLFATPQDLDAKIREYQAECDKAKKPVLLTGLVLHLGFRSKQALYNQGQRTDNESDDGPTWSQVIDYACLLFEHEHEKGLHKGGNAGGHIFGLMNANRRNENGWVNKQQHEHSGPDGTPIQYQELSDDELDAEIRRLAEETGVGLSAEGEEAPEAGTPDN